MKTIMCTAASLGMASVIALAEVFSASTETPSTGQGRTTTTAGSVASAWSLDGHLPRVVSGHGVAAAAEQLEWVAQPTTPVMQPPDNDMGVVVFPVIMESIE